MSCLHEKTAENYPECETVCTLCSLVLQPWEVLPHPIVDELHYGELQVYLEDLVHNSHIYEGVVKPVLHYYQLIRDNEKLRTFRGREILCYCLFSELLKNNVGRSMNEIAYFGDVNKTRLYKIQKLLSDTYELEPEDLLMRLMDEMKIPFSFHSRITHILQELHKLSSSKPETKAACAILLCCDNKNFSIDKRELCRQVGVQWPSVRTLLKRYEKYRCEK